MLTPPLGCDKALASWFSSDFGPRQRVNINYLTSLCAFCGLRMSDARSTWPSHLTLNLHHVASQTLSLHCVKLVILKNSTKMLLLMHTSQTFAFNTKEPWCSSLWMWHVRDSNFQRARCPTFMGTLASTCAVSHWGSILLWSSPVLHRLMP